MAIQQNQNDSNYIERLITIRRVAKTVKGGRIMSFSALTVVGDGNGRVGIGTGKSREVPVAVQKAMESAKRNMVKVNLVDGTLQYPVEFEHSSARVRMLPASKGTGIVAGGTMRAIFEAAGIEDVLAKVIGRTTNPINVSYATVKGLATMDTPDYIAAKRGKSVAEILG